MLRTPLSTIISQDIFARTAALDCHASLALSYMEIYKDEVYDLLVDRDTVSLSSASPTMTVQHPIQAVKLPVRENEAGQVFVANLSVIAIEDMPDFDRIFT